MSEKAPFLSVYGHVTIDQIISVKNFPKLNESVDVVQKQTLLGGTGSNIAMAAATLGIPTAICSFVGNDYPQMYEEQMIKAGLIMDDFVKVSQFETSQALVLNNAEKEQQVIFYQGPQGYASQLNMKLTNMAQRSKFVHFCTGEPEYYISLMNDLQSPNRFISVDPAQEVYKMWDTDKITRALEKSDALFCNDFEAKVLNEYLGIDDILSLDMDLVVRTEGKNGSVAKIGGEVVKIPLIAGKEMKDPTGAGDAYRAGFYAGIYNGYDEYQSLVIASAVSSYVVEEIGALTNLPTWDMALERAEKYL